jgi:hypothetical protein
VQLRGLYSPTELVKEYTEPRFFRAKVKIWLRQVKALWPQSSAFISPDGSSIEIQSSRANPPIPSVGKPGIGESIPIIPSGGSSRVNGRI